MDHAPRRLGQRTVRLSAWLDGLDWRRDLALPAVLLVVQLTAAAATVAGHHSPTKHLAPANWALLVVGPLALVFRRRWPVAVLWVAFAATLTSSGAWSANLSLIVAFFLAATSGHRPAAWVVIVTGYLCSVWLAPLAYGNPGVSLARALALAGWLAVLVVAAEVVRLRRERTVEIRATRVLDARRRASEERLQMARDLHDVIGHNISLINVQAGVGLDLMDTQPEQARAALAAIKEVSKDALDELRTMLTALRQDDEDAPRAPAPGLGRLEELVELTRAAGIPVTVRTVGEARSLPAAVDLAAYRIVQESLTNVARHAGTATATVRLTHGPDGLDIEVCDDGHTLATNGASPGAGSGIVGMRERARALGGRLQAGPRPGGGFAVRAHFPLGGLS
ncbi:MAG TPA: sensor histidine kinase [Acidimicrobiales bacterium]|nr:sensor histidine kinase [Acidimicrobiales bacterium]